MNANEEVKPALKLILAILILVVTMAIKKDASLTLSPENEGDRMWQQRW